MPGPQIVGFSPRKFLKEQTAEGANKTKEQHNPATAGKTDFQCC